MCKVYNSVGCLTTVKTHLKRHNINDFNSINEVLNFLKNFATFKNQIIEKHQKLIENEKVILEAEISELNNTIKTDRISFENIFNLEIEELTQTLNNLSSSAGLNFFQRIIYFVKQKSLKKKIYTLKQEFDDKVSNAVSKLEGQLQFKINRFNYITSHFKNAVNESSVVEINKIDNKLKIIDEVKNSIYGALGEHKVVKELENLGDNNFLINDFILNFHPAIYNRQENDYIKSIQIDHILITPSGIFIIETKNWSEKSMERLDLRSPVQQIKRTNFALFKVLTDDISSGRVKIKQHHWGDRKIRVKNLIILTNSKPNEEFHYVKVLTVNELINYISHFKPIFTDDETESFANRLLKLNNQKIINN